MRGLWKGFWQLSKTERIGYLLLIALLSLHFTIDAWGPRSVPLSQEVLASMPEQGPLADTLPLTASQEERSLFYFDINLASTDELRRLGLGDRAIQGLLRFRSKGGKVRNERDFNKLFSLTAADKERLRPWLRFPGEAPDDGESADGDKERVVKESSTVFQPVELNAADSMQLLTVPGIGPAFASRIIRYRDRLGGFVEPAQLREVFGIDSVKYEALWPLVRISAHSVKKWHPCEASEEELAAHPYIGKVMARRWVAYRQQRGCKGCSDLEKMPGMDPARWQKLAPYFTCEGLH